MKTVESRLSSWGLWLREPPVWSCLPSETMEYRLMHEGPDAMLIHSTAPGGGGLDGKVSQLAGLLKLSSEVMETGQAVRLLPTGALRKQAFCAYVFRDDDYKRQEVKPRHIAAAELRLTERRYREQRVMILHFVAGFLCIPRSEREVAAGGLTLEERMAIEEHKVPGLEFLERLRVAAMAEQARAAKAVQQALREAPDFSGRKWATLSLRKA